MVTSAWHYFAPRVSDRLETEAQRHLDLPRASDGLVRDAQAARGWADVQRSCEVRVARIRCGWRTNDGKAIEVDVLADVVDWNVETRGVGQVENVEAELQGGTLGDLGELDQRDVRAPLPGLPENIALAMVDKVRLVRIIGRDRAAQGART